MLTVVLDTNVLVSGLLSQKSWPAKILDLILADHIHVAYDDRILGEYEEVLSRPELHIPPPRMFRLPRPTLNRQSDIGAKGSIGQNQ